MEVDAATALTLPDLSDRAGQCEHQPGPEPGRRFMFMINSCGLSLVAFSISE
jgi:hypothetical protein